MKTSLKLFALGMILMGFGANANAQATANSAASATIVTTISIANDIPMNFGNLATNGTVGTVTLPTTAVRTFTGGVTLPVNTGSPTAAQFTVKGEKGYTFALTAPSAALTLTHTSSTETMTVDTWTNDLGATGTLDATSGEKVILFGATLHVKTTSLAGTYQNLTGFPVTVNYN